MRESRLPDSGFQCLSLDYLLEHRAMTRALVGAVTTNRDRRAARERGQQSDSVACRRFRQLSLVGPEKPAADRWFFAVATTRAPEQRRAWRYDRKPDIEVAVARPARARDPAGRTPRGADPQTFTAPSGSGNLECFQRQWFFHNRTYPLCPQRPLWWRA